MVVKMWNASWQRLGCPQVMTQGGRSLSMLGLAMMLGLSSTIAMTSILATPTPAEAYTARVALFLNRNPGESYETFLRRAEVIARAAIQRSFDVDLLTTEAVITIVGQNQGIAIPVMEVDVTRNEWRDRPDPQYWARYYESAPRLLAF